MDYVLGADEVTPPDTGLTTGDMDYLNQQATAVTEMAIVAIVVIVVVALLLLTSKKNKSTKRR